MPDVTFPREFCLKVKLTSKVIAKNLKSMPPNCIHANTLYRQASNYSLILINRSSDPLLNAAILNSL